MGLGYGVLLTPDKMQEPVQYNTYPASRVVEPQREFWLSKGAGIGTILPGVKIERGFITQQLLPANCLCAGPHGKRQVNSQWMGWIRDGENTLVHKRIKGSSSPS